MDLGFIYFKQLHKFVIELSFWKKHINILHNLDGTGYGAVISHVWQQHEKMMEI